MSATQLKPLYDQVLIEQFKAEEKTAAGIIMPASTQKKINRGKVIAVGSGKREKGQVYPIAVKIGDIIIFNEYAGTEFEEQGEKYRIIRESDILAIAAN
jgi:chaperonin GroES